MAPRAHSHDAHPVNDHPDPPSQNHLQWLMSRVVSPDGVYKGKSQTPGSVPRARSSFELHESEAKMQQSATRQSPHGGGKAGRSRSMSRAASLGEFHEDKSQTPRSLSHAGSAFEWHESKAQKHHALTRQSPE